MEALKMAVKPLSISQRDISRMDYAKNAELIQFVIWAMGLMDFAEYAVMIWDMDFDTI